VVAALALGLAWLVNVATDEGGVSWGERAGRTLPLAPACAAIGTWVALAPLHASSEGAPNTALGQSRAGFAAAAVAGGTLIALLAAVILGTVPAVTLTAFFPKAARSAAWVWQDGGFVDRAQGLRVGQDGTPTLLAAKVNSPFAAIPRQGRAGAALAIAFAGLALPFLVARASLARSLASRFAGEHRRDTRADLGAIVAVAAGLALSAVAFQAAAAWKVSALLGAAPSALLLAFAVRRYRASL
jgi:hypothetical protein